jgi:UDP-N-acetylglucosamine 1-carboxyvinyltransferase
MERPEQDFPSLVQDGRTTHVVVPVDEYERLLLADMVQSALAKRDDPDTEYIDADDFGIELAAQSVAEARKAAGLTQKQLGEKVGIPQSQVSRIERRPDRTTVRTLRRLAKALKVDVGVFLKGL